MDPLRLVLEVTRRISSFVRREVLGVFLPGLLTFLGITWALSLPRLLAGASMRTPAGLVSESVDLVIPEGDLARAVFLLVTGYFAFGLGQLSRMVVFWLVFRGKRPEDAYLDELVNAWYALGNTFGFLEVTETFERHSIAAGLKASVERRVNSQRQPEEDGDDVEDPGVAGGQGAPASPSMLSLGAAPPLSRSLADTRMEFNYCKAWLSIRGSKLATDHFEDTINLLCSMTVPLATITFLVAEYLYLEVLPWDTLVRLPLTAAGWLVVTALVSSAVMTEVRKQQRHETFDTLKHFFYQNRMDAVGAGVPSGPDPERTGQPQTIPEASP